MNKNQVKNSLDALVFQTQSSIELAERLTNVLDALGYGSALQMEAAKDALKMAIEVSEQGLQFCLEDATPITIRSEREATIKVIHGLLERLSNVKIKANKRKRPVS